MSRECERREQQVGNLARGGAASQHSKLWLDRSVCRERVLSYLNMELHAPRREWVLSYTCANPPSRSLLCNYCTLFLSYVVYIAVLSSLEYVRSSIKAISEIKCTRSCLKRDMKVHCSYCVVRVFMLLFS